MKRVCICLFFTMALIITGCSGSDIDSPTQQLDKYIAKWEEVEFTSMYDMLSDDTKEMYDEESFVERYEKIYHDLSIDDLDITYEELDKKVIKEAKKDKTISIPLDVSMESMAGPIAFTNEMELTLKENEEDEEESEWLIEWDPGFIFPDLKDDGKISVSTEEAKRGEIIDRNQMPLALNDLAYEVGVVPESFENEENEKEELARLLHMSVDSIDKRLNEDWVEPGHFVPLKTIPQSDESTLNQVTTLPAVQTQDTTGRNYPAGKAAAHLTGYVATITEEELEEADAGQYTPSDVIGKAGLEKMYEEKLRGENGVKIVITKQTDDGEEEVTLAEKPVKNGEKVQVDIDVNLQESIYETYEKEGLAGTAAAIHPKTGEILALISSPGYDPNELTFGITQERWDSLMENTQEPFVNRFTSIFAPGSAFKPITATIGLNDGTINHTDTMEIDGLKWGKESWGDVKITRVSTSDKPVDLRDALQRSDNIYFARQALDIGHEQFEKGLRELGFEEEIPLPFTIKASEISNSKDLKDEILLANTSYGQGEIEMSSLHLALIYSAFLNDGNIVKPSFLHEDKKDEIWLEDVMKPEDTEKMQEYLREVVTEGTAESALDDDLDISGKTGTVELKQSQDSKGHDNGWFVGYPTDDQDVLIAMMMEHTENLGASSFVAENVKDILVDYKK